MSIGRIFLAVTEMLVLTVESTQQKCCWLRSSPLEQCPDCQIVRWGIRKKDTSGRSERLHRGPCPLWSSLLARVCWLAGMKNYLTNIRNVECTYVHFVFKAISPSRQSFGSVNMYKSRYRYTRKNNCWIFLLEIKSKFISRNPAYSNLRVSRADSNQAPWMDLNGTCQSAHASVSPRISRRDWVPFCLL